MENQNLNTQNSQVKKQDNTPAIVSYLGPFGWIIAFVLYKNNKTEFNTFHLKQALGVSIIAVFGYIAAVIIDTLFFNVLSVAFIGNFLYWLVYAVAGIFYIIGLINSANGQQKYLPVAGEKFEKMFAGIVN